MSTRRQFIGGTIQRRRSRSVAILAAAGAIAAGAVTFTTSAVPASAALGLTEFEIDGNIPVDGGQDWASDPADVPNLRDLAETFDGCEDSPLSVGDDTDRVVPGTKIDDLGFNAVPINDGTPNKKSDLCSVYQAWELVLVPDPVDGGQYEFVFYGGWTRPNVNGEIDVLFPLLGSDPTSNEDDLVVSYDFVDSTDATTVDILAWDAAESAWVSTGGLAADEFEAVTTRGVETNGTFDLTFGEFAINLTRAGILPENGPCLSFTAGDPISRTGNSASASLEDIVDVDPIVLTNCGSLTITKETTPASPAGSPAFDVHTEQLDSQPLQFGDVTALDDTLVVPDSPSVTHVDLLISPDYTVAETDLPPGWAQDTLVCQSFDPIAGVPVEVTLYSGGAAGPDDAFPIAPATEATCTVSNTGPPTVTVQKTTIGGAGGPFGFTVTDAGGDTALSATTVAADTPTTVDEGTIEVDPGPVSVAETSIADGFFEGPMSCTVDGEPIAGNSADLASGQTMLCVQQNLAAGSVQVTKSIDGTATDWAFDFTISPVPAGETATKTATAAAPTVGWGDLEPGTDYTITETPVDGFITGTLVCGAADGVGTSTFSTGPGGTVDCTISNIELGAVQVTKSIDGTATDWAFDFTISPVPAGETATKTATAAAPTVGWDGLTPGASYTITETPSDGFVTGVLSCAGGENAVGSSTFGVEPGQTTDCTVTNIELATVDVTKTVDPDEDGWAFDFTISPVPAGETATKTATAAAPTVGWDGLTPGTEYTITESADSDLVVGVMTCAGAAGEEGSASFTPDAGQAVACAITNTRIADIEVVKSSSPATVLPGGTVTWTIEVTNNGPSTALDVVLTDATPTSMTLVSVDGPASWDCDASVTGNPGTVSCTKPDMIPGESWTFQVVTTVSPTATGGTTITNVASVATTTDETTTDNNSDDAAVGVELVAILPPTGGYVWDRIAIGSTMIGLGLVLLLGVRRRRGLVS